MRVVDIEATVESIFDHIGNTSQREIARRLQVSNTAVTKWKYGRTLPSIDTLVAMTELFDCTLNDLVKAKEIS